jgi:prevent-host-death family protein
MTVLTASAARANLYRLIDQATESHEPVLIAGKKSSAVLVSAEDWAAIQETMHLLSVPGMRGMVPRALRIRYAGFDPQGRPIEREVEGFHARVVQHDCDHLWGILYPMRIRDMSKFGFTAVLFPDLDDNADD